MAAILLGGTTVRVCEIPERTIGVNLTVRMCIVPIIALETSGNDSYHSVLLNEFHDRG